jgi:hypothetical protein
MALRGHSKKTVNLKKSSVCSSENKKAMFFGSVSACTCCATYPQQIEKQGRPSWRLVWGRLRGLSLENWFKCVALR